ncbi:hypothetical protein DdX_00703 [Ditylenchus destructor]|uniref:Uncharacterized protein n=1 Tax=Ditylenchus destructor TaxID=166010 RepID=A0AAD4NL16_9BILA|nr:hypothetical protein DdX_00703 [Ditylenchus destructor]
MTEPNLPDEMLADFKSKLIATIGSEGSEGMTLSRLTEMFQKDWNEPISTYVAHFNHVNLLNLLCELVNEVKVQRDRGQEYRVIPVNAPKQKKILHMIDNTKRVIDNRKLRYTSRRLKQNNICTAVNAPCPRLLNRIFSHSGTSANTLRQIHGPMNRIQCMPYALNEISFHNARRIYPLSSTPILNNFTSGAYTVSRGWANLSKSYSSSVVQSAKTNRVDVNSQEKPLTAVLFSPTPNLPYKITASILPSQKKSFQLPEIVQKEKKIHDTFSPPETPKNLGLNANNTLQQKAGENACQEELQKRKSIVMKGGTRLFSQTINALSKQAKEAVKTVQDNSLTNVSTEVPTAVLKKNSNTQKAEPVENAVAPQVKAINCEPFVAQCRAQAKHSRKNMQDINACISRIVLSEKVNPTYFNAAYFVEQLDANLPFLCHNV